jgi:4-amino-4-deoxy-L-arabinose transferase-like glycosyltransferase
MKDKLLVLLEKIDRLVASNRVYIVLIGLAVVTRLMGWALGGIRGDDEGPYFQMAHNFLTGRGIGLDEGWSYAQDGFLRSWLPPGFALLRIPFLLVFENDLLPLRIFFVSLSVFTHVLFFPLCKRFFSPRYAFLAALLWILYPAHWFWGTRICPHTYAFDLVIICFYLVFLSWERKSIWLPFLIGVLWTSLCLMRGEYLFGILSMALAVFFTSTGRPYQIKFSILLFLGCILTFAPWVIRNYRLHHQFMLLANNAADNFWFAYNPAYDFSGDMVSFPEDFKEVLRAEPNEVKRAKIIRDDAIKYIKENPGRTTYIVFRNFLNYWRPWLTPKVTSWPENITYTVTYLLLFVFFVMGLFRVPWKQPQWVLIISFLVYKMMIHIPFYVIVRFRETTTPFMIIVATLGLQYWLEKKPR